MANDFFCQYQLTLNKSLQTSLKLAKIVFEAPIPVNIFAFGTFDLGTGSVNITLSGGTATTLDLVSSPEVVEVFVNQPPLILNPDNLDPSMANIPNPPRPVTGSGFFYGTSNATFTTLDFSFDNVSLGDNTSFIVGRIDVDQVNSVATPEPSTIFGALLVGIFGAVKLPRRLG